MARAVARSTQTPEAASVMCALGVLATCLQRRFEVAPYGDEYRETLSLWTLSALPSGSRKTSIINAFTAPLLRYEKLERDRLRPEVVRAASTRLVTKKRIEALALRASKTPDRDDREQLRKEIEEEELGMPKDLCYPRLFTGDCTPERVQQLLCEHGERMAVLSDEAGIFQILAGQYSGGMANIDAFLQAYSGSPVRVDRAGREAHVDRPALSFALMLQPGVLADVASSKRFRDSGLLARFVYCLPKSTVGNRDVRKHEGISQDLVRDWENTTLSLLSRDTPATPNDPIVLTLSPEARELWFAFSEEIEKHQADGGRLESIRDWTSKLPGNVARISAIMELVQTPGEARQVSADSMSRAVRLATFLIPHAQAAFRLLGADAIEADAEALLNWIRTNELTGFTRREAQKALEGRFRSLAPLEAAITRLREWEVLSGPSTLRKEGARRPSVWYDVNPRVLVEKSNLSRKVF